MLCEHHFVACSLESEAMRRRRYLQWAALGGRAQVLQPDIRAVVQQRNVSALPGTERGHSHLHYVHILKVSLHPVAPPMH